MIGPPEERGQTAKIFEALSFSDLLGEKVSFCFLVQQPHSARKFRCFLKGFMEIGYIIMVPQNKKLSVKRLMKYFSHDYSDHDQSKAREMATLQLKYLNALLFITVAVLQQQATINHINHPIN